MGRALRFSGILPPRAREIAILIVAAAERSDFEWAAHAAIGAHIGLSADELGALARSEVTEFPDPVENAVARATRAIVATGDLGDDDYRAAQVILGDAS